MEEPSSDYIDADYRQYRRNLIQTMMHVLIYYGGFIGTGMLIIWLYPHFLSTLPVGGLSEFSVIAGKTSETLLKVNEANAPSDWITGMTTLATALFCTIALMIPVAWVYNATHEGDEFDHSIPETILVLPAVVAGVVMIVQHSLALAFSLAGIVAGVRFRRALQDTFDALFILTAISVGLAAGVHALEVAVVATVFFNLAALITCYISPGLESRYVYQKKLREQDEKRERELQDRQSANGDDSNND
ncbi:hypothetical protein LJ739_08660 [Aestuariibacter halophilus]|uniref:DUF4956 domain-containing protein n=1 Tax=Fluctibacter halophilus TaxID=226011 RepID=A0ABS8G747_9ALTE|nr:DUF4956 domain-containing protein [Aestuariibacter halophilus]MCC2616309.1 hypothetical protein [Aestuariibacter halophilus]